MKNILHLMTSVLLIYGCATSSDPRTVKAAIKENQTQLHTCYTKKNAPGPGKYMVEMKFTIMPDGTTSDVRLTSKNDKVIPRPFLDCLKSKIITWKFPKPRDSKRVEVIQPVHFNP